MSGPRTLVIGAGIVGSAAVWDLVRRGHEVTVADSRREIASGVADRYGATPAMIDVLDRAEVSDLMSDHEATVAAVPFEYGTALARAALDAGCHYFDFGGNPTVVKTQLALHDAAADRHLALVPDCGLAPGLANVIAAGMIEAAALGFVDKVQLRVGALPVKPSGPLGYGLEFSSAGLINEYAEPCEVIQDGAANLVEPLTGLETVEWREWGPLEAFHTAGGTSTMCRDYAGRVGALDYKTLRYPGHCRIFAAMRWLGLFETDDLTGIGVTPRAMLLDLLDRRLPLADPDLVLIRVAVTAGGETTTNSIVARPAAGFSALARATALPATALCDLIVRGAVGFRGAAAMHRAVDSGTLLGELDALALDRDVVRGPA